MTSTTHTKRTVLRVALVLVSSTACGPSVRAPATTTEVPPATSAAGVPSLAAGPPSLYRSIQVNAGSRQAPVPMSLAGGIAPLLIARDFGQQSSLADYHLDHPAATIVYAAPSGTFSVDIGAANFDHTGYYAMRSDRIDVYLVLGGGVTPVLQLVGIAT